MEKAIHTHTPKEGDFLFPVQQVKSTEGNTHLNNKYKVAQTEKSATQICQRGEIIGQTAAPKIGETENTNNPNLLKQKPAIRRISTGIGKPTVIDKFLEVQCKRG